MKGTEMSRSTKSFSLILAGALLASALSSVALAAPVSSGSGAKKAGNAESDSGVWSRVSLRGSTDRHATRFAGAVWSEDECTSDRKITLFHITRSGRDESVATTRSGSFGDYHVRLGSGARGRYYTKAARTAVADQYGDLLVCKAALSQLVRI
jgi:hypothetical protein